MIKEIRSGKIYLYAAIEAFHIGPKFSQLNKPSNCFLVRYETDLWSWRFFHDFTKENSKENIQFTNLMKEDNPNPEMGARFFNDASNVEQTNHTCGFTLIDKNVFDNKENSFIYRQHFDDWIGAFNGSLNIVSAQDVPIRWMNAFKENFDTSVDLNIDDNLFSKEYLLEVSKRWGIDAEAGHMIEKGYNVTPNGNGKYSIGTSDYIEVMEEKEKFTKSVDKHFRNQG